MQYQTDSLTQVLLGNAVVAAARAAGNNPLISYDEQEQLPVLLDEAADRVRARKGKGATVDVGEVVSEYAAFLEDNFDRVNLKGRRWLSLPETEALPKSLAREVMATRETIAAGAALPDVTSASGEFRRVLSDRFDARGQKKIKVAFFDADSTLRVSKSGSVSANSPDDVELLPFVGAKIKELVEQGYLIAIVSNQQGVEKGYVTLHTADSALELMSDLVRRSGGDVHYIDFAETSDDNRKPGVLMAERLEQKLQERFGADVTIDRETSKMIGDSAYKGSDTRPNGEPGTHFSNSDRLFAENYGIEFVEPQFFFGWHHFGREGFEKVSEVNAFWLGLKR